MAQVKKGSWWYYTLEVGENGRRKQKWFGRFRTKREAASAEAKARTRISEGGIIEPSRQTLDHYLTAEWLPAIRSTVRPGTFDSYSRLLRLYALPTLGQVQLRQLTPAKLNALYGRLLESGRHRGSGGLAPRSVRYVHVILHRALKDAVRWGKLARNVADLADPPHVVELPARAWNAEELGRFLDGVADDRLYAGWLLLAMTGLRRGELLGLRWQDVDLEAGCISVVQALVLVGNVPTVSEPKTRAGRRVVALDPATVDALRAHKVAQVAERLTFGPGWRRSDLVFTNAEGTPVNPDNFSGWFEQHVRRLGLPRLTVHGLRHTHATVALRAAVPAKVVAERLGHANIRVTLQTYSHVSPGMQEEAAAKVAALIPRGVGGTSVRRPLEESGRGSG